MSVFILAPNGLALALKFNLLDKSIGLRILFCKGFALKPRLIHDCISNSIKI